MAQPYNILTSFLWLIWFYEMNRYVSESSKELPPDIIDSFIQFVLVID